MDNFNIAGSDPLLLEKARSFAKSYASTQISGDTVGVAFLGAIVRGYFDAESDIDICFFTRNTKESGSTRTETIDGFQVHSFISNFDHESTAEWNMSKRWAFSQVEYFYDPTGKVKELMARKVPYHEGERESLIKSGITLSEWYLHRLSALWIKRGSIASAHLMINEGLNHYFNCLFALNDQLTADYKWRLFCAQNLEILPSNFTGAISEILVCKEITETDLERRVNAFMGIWKETLGIVEEQLKQKYEDFRDTV